MHEKRTLTFAGAALVLHLALLGCSPSNPADPSGSGGQTATGGTNTGGATTATGGSTPGSGGGTGGRSDTAGTGGEQSSGGASPGGSNGRGGTPGAGGTAGGGAGGGASGSAGTVGTGGAGAIGGGTLPGDIAASAGTPLVAAHSMVRAMYAAYNGKLFQVRRSDGKTQDIGPASAGGKVDASALSAFCAASSCTIAVLYDQSGNANHLPQTDAASQMLLQYYATPGGAQVPMAVTVSKQYLRNRTNTTKIPLGAASQTEYFVVNTKFFNEKCCWDYGNMEQVAKVSSTNGPGKMSALNIGTSDNGYANPGAGSGPWGMVDYEAGVYSGAYRIGQVNPNNPSLTWPIATVLSKTNGTTSWVLKVGDAAKGTLITAWNGALPPGYNPLKQEGGLSLGEGGDGSKLGTGAFFEGVVIADVTSDATDAAIQAGLMTIFK
jgi:non-reducing end alpha-L-arabinofuranosidase